MTKIIHVGLARAPMPFMSNGLLAEAGACSNLLRVDVPV